MEYTVLAEMRDMYVTHKNKIPKEAAEKFEKAFDIEYTHDSTTIEGNTLSLVETKVVLEDKTAIGGKTLREIYEIVNHDRAFHFVKQCIAANKPLDQHIVKDIHMYLMDNILQGGFYRNVDVRITGAKHKPPSPSDMYTQILDFFGSMEKNKVKMNPIEYAAWTHAEFVRIHPFVDGNGRTSRLIMNYQLMRENFLPVSIAAQNKLEYFTALEAYAVNGDLKPFTEIVAKLELNRLENVIDMINQVNGQSQSQPEMGI